MYYNITQNKENQAPFQALEVTSSSLMFTGSPSQFHSVVVKQEEDFQFETEDDDEELIQMDNQSWKCGICGKMFDLECTAVNHVVAHRSLPGGGLTCLMCGLTFKEKLDFAFHLSSQHKKPLP